MEYSFPPEIASVEKFLLRQLFIHLLQGLPNSGLSIGCCIGKPSGSIHRPTGPENCLEHERNSCCFASFANRTGR